MATESVGDRFRITNLHDIDPVPCPCGSTRRAFTQDPEQIASIHLVTAAGPGKRHYHRKMTEIYYFIEGEGQMELDGQLFPVGPGSVVLIKPGCRHRAVGTFRFVNVPIPAFDPHDEWFD